jgi:hypothetical protein
VDQAQHVEVAGQNAQPDRLEERRLELEFERLKFDRQKVSTELLLKRRELNAAKNKEWKDILANPLTLAIVGGFITLMTTTITGHFSALQSIDAETTKARQALQTDLIKKFVDNPNPQTVRANLQFLVDVGLVPSYADSLRSFLDNNPNSALPSAFTPGAVGLQNVHTDDDAIDLVMRLEGGFVNNPGHPEGATNFGIKVSDLAGYLGKPATVDDLRNLTVQMARDIYRQRYLIRGASGLASAQVKAAYLGLAVHLGTPNAVKLFQAAISKIDQLPVSESPFLDAETVQRLNAVDPDVLIETANCEAAKLYERKPQFKEFGAGWINRLRIFSPVTLKGICPELQAVGSTTPSKP